MLRERAQRAFWGQRYATLRDPDGNGVDLFAALADELRRRLTGERVDLMGEVGLVAVAGIERRLDQ